MELLLRVILYAIWLEQTSQAFLIHILYISPYLFLFDDLTKGWVTSMMWHFISDEGAFRKRNTKPFHLRPTLS